MNYQELIFDLMGYSDVLMQIWTQFMDAFLLVGIVVCLLNCLFGYKLRKVWPALVLFILGFAIMLAAGNSFMDDRTAAVITAVVFGIVMAVVSVFVYRFALLLASAALIYGLLYLLIPDPITIVKVIYVIVGIIIGRMVLRFERPLTIVLTAVCGGVGGLTLLFMFLEKDTSSNMLLMGFAAAIIGLILQFVTTYEEPERACESHAKRRRIEAEAEEPVCRPQKKRKKRPVEKNVFQLMNESLRGEDEEDDEYEEDDYDEEAAYEAYVEEQQRRHRASGPAFFEIIDMDDISKEMSEDIKQIYQEQKSRK